MPHAAKICAELHQVNPYVKSFLTMSDYCDQHSDIASKMFMVINVNRNDETRRYNDAIQTDVAVIFRRADDEPPFERNMVVFSKFANTSQNVSVLNSYSHDRCRCLNKLSNK